MPVTYVFFAYTFYCHPPIPHIRTMTAVAAMTATMIHPVNTKKVIMTFLINFSHPKVNIPESKNAVPKPPNIIEIGRSPCSKVVPSIAFISKKYKSPAQTKNTTPAIFPDFDLLTLVLINKFINLYKFIPKHSRLFKIKLSSGFMHIFLYL